MNVPRPATTGGSSSVPQNNDLFSSQDGLLKLLVAIRGSSMPSESKIMARDAVLEYSQQTDQEARSQLKKNINSILSPYQKDFAVLFASQPVANTAISVTNDHVTEVVSPRPTPDTSAGFRGARPTPVFGAGTTPAKPAEIKENKVPTRPAPVVAASSNQNTQTAPPSVTPQASSVPSSASEIKKPSPEITAPTQTPNTVPVSGRTTLDDHMERIKAIKRSVNERVGNPINLIDTNNEVGREYMNALLDAMKRVSGDGAGADRSMERLESAYKAVEELLASGVVVGKSKPSPTVKVEKTDVQEAYRVQSAPRTAPVEPPVETAVKPTPPQSTVTSSKIPLREIKLSAVSEPQTKLNESPVIDRAVVKVTTSTKPAQSKEASTLEKASPEQPVTKPKQEEPAINHQLHSLAEPEPVKAAAGTDNGQKRTETKKGGLWSRLSGGDKKSVSKSDHSTAARSVPSAPLNKTPTLPVDDRLFNVNVNTGLEQLLSEWKLFKSSGFLGTGPGGKDHPLYKSLSQLPMAAVIAGRFEGASPEVKQSITDYMNGWRYEQGVIHELNETFEHYLRRVIAHILERAVKEKGTQENK